MGFVQSISEFTEKSCIDTNTQTFLDVCCVAFFTLNNERANLVLIYFNKAIASSLFVNLPILMKVSVTASFGPIITGVLNVSPNAPVPLPSVITTLKNFRYSFSITYLLGIYLYTLLLSTLAKIRIHCSFFDG